MSDEAELVKGAGVLEVSTEQMTRKGFLEAYGKHPITTKILPFLHFPDDEVKIPSVIYHYCPIESFIGILATKEIWGAHHSQTNDSLEGTYFLEQINREVERRKTPENEAKLLRMIQHAKLNVADYFIASFSEEEDSLSQWRSYASDGRGFCIGFYTESFGIVNKEPALMLGGGNVGIVPVSYANAEALASDLVELALAGMFGAGDLPSLHRFMYGFKHRSFMEEKEVRIVEVQKLDLPLNVNVTGMRTLTPGAGLDFRVVGLDRIAPYRRYAFSSTGSARLHSIWLGPRNNTSLVFLNLYLQKMRISVDNGILRSDSSYIG